MAKNRALISEEPLEVKHVSWETRAVFRMVATPRKVLARLLSMPQSDSYSSNLISADGSRNPISEAALKSLKFPRGTAGVEFSYSYVSYVLSGGCTTTIWVELNFHEKTLSLQGDERSVLSVAMWLVTTFKPEEIRRERG